MEGSADPGGLRRRSEQFLTLPELLDILRAAGRVIGLAIELKHPNPYQLRLEDRVLEVLRNEGWNPASSMLANIRVSFMSFSPDAVKHLLQSVPAEAVCQLVDHAKIAEIREELGLGALTGGALANVMRAARSEGERILDAEAGIAGPGIGYVRRTDKLCSAGWARDAASGCGRSTPNPTSSGAGNWGSTRSPPLSAQVLSQLLAHRQPLL